jgi:hypothetical protein
MFKSKILRIEFWYKREQNWQEIEKLRSQSSVLFFTKFYLSYAVSRMNGVI